MYPNLRSEELMRAHDAPTPIELIKSILRPGEIEDISIQIEKLSGYRTDTVRLVEDIKKSKNGWGDATPLLPFSGPQSPSGGLL